MYTSQITTIAFAAGASFIQICPASIIGDVVDTGVQAVTDLALVESGNVGRRSDITDNIDQCIHDGRAQTEYVQVIGERDVIMDGVSLPMSNSMAWNISETLAVEDVLSEHSFSTSDATAVRYHLVHSVLYG